MGRFSIETFIVAPGVGPAPDEFTAPPFPDATSNPATPPIQTYHLGLWFNRPADAAAEAKKNVTLQAIVCVVASSTLARNNRPLTSSSSADAA